MTKQHPFSWRQPALAALLLLLTALLAQVERPFGFTPVANTFALVAVYLTGALLEKRLALATQLCYLAAGLLGVPVFPGGVGGLHAVAGPGGGYLSAYPLIAVLVAYGLERWGRSPAKYLLFMALAQAAGYLVGIVQLWRITGAGWGDVLHMGLTPFLLPDLVQVAAAALVALTADRICRSIPLAASRH